MKRGKDDEKIMGPMFPRLHVNDTDKGGPRAPPRNKMALYEQLSIPTQRFNPGVLPRDPTNTSNFVAPGSSSQGGGHDRNLIVPVHVSPSTPINLPEKLPDRSPDRPNTNIPLAQFESKKKVGNEDDFTVPVFVHSGMGHQFRTQNGVDREKLTPFSSTYSGHSIKTHFNRDPKQINSKGPSSREEGRLHGKGDSIESVLNRGNSVEATSKLSSEKIDGHEKEANTFTSQEHSCNPAANLTRFHDSDACVRQYSGDDSQPDSAIRCDIVESMRIVEEGTVPQSRSGSRSGGYCGSEHRGDKTYESFQLGNEDKGDDLSETSMVDSISGLDISPDDVVGIIGQKHFWKARKAIANQQRVFAVQVFELHRLIKVQRLIAGSPHLLLEGGAYLGKPTLKCSPTNKVSSEYVVKPLPHIVKRKDDSEKPNRKMECSAENTAGKTSLSSVKNGSQPSTHGPYPGNLPQTPVAADAKMTSWFHQSSGHQWLVPVMSPSEGLVYKPYPGPGFPGAFCGGCGPYGPTPMTGNFMNLAYGIPANHHHPGIGVLPGVPPVGHGYCPPYVMPVMNPAISSAAVEQTHQFPGPGSHGQASKLSGGGANFNVQYQSSCNIPTQKNGSVTQAVKFQASKDTDLQGSTASSPGEKVQRTGAAPAAEARDALPLFPVAPVVLDGACQPHDTGQPTRVIKVVPHNPRLATESAARIFRSIQEERKQFDST